MFCRKIDTDWRFRRVGDEDLMGACVPGSVYTDLLKNGKMEDPFWKDNENKALVLMQDDYEYLLYSIYLVIKEHINIIGIHEINLSSHEIGGKRTDNGK